MVKKLCIKDQFEIKELFHNVFSKPPWNDQWDDHQLGLYLKDLINQENSLSLGYYHDDTLIGLSLGYLFHWWTGTEYFIKEFCIDQDYQHKGYGSLFLKEIEIYLADESITAICLSTERNLPAFSFYQKNGFNELSDYVLLAKNIKQNNGAK